VIRADVIGRGDLADVGERICLRCDWAGGDGWMACPTCGARLYRVPETTTREATPIPRPPVRLPREDDRVLPSVPVAARRRGRVIGGAITVAVIWIVATGVPFDRLRGSTAPGPSLAVVATPVDEPPAVNPEDAAAEKIALGFLDAYAAFDAHRAMTYLADDAELQGPIDAAIEPYQGLANTERLSRTLSLLQAVGYEQTVTSCVTAAFGSDTSVVCDFVFNAIGSDQVGRGPFAGNSFVFTIRDGAIVRASQHWNPESFAPQMWEPFAAWVSSTYPKDVAVMYLDGTLANVRLSPKSIRLWGRHTRGYIEAVKRGTA
jgi:hypothetical protein